MFLKTMNNPTEFLFMVLIAPPIQSLSFAVPLQSASKAMAERAIDVKLRELRKVAMENKQRGAASVGKGTEGAGTGVHSSSPSVKRARSLSPPANGGGRRRSRSRTLSRSPSRTPPQDGGGRERERERERDWGQGQQGRRSRSPVRSRRRREDGGRREVEERRGEVGWGRGWERGGGGGRDRDRRGRDLDRRDRGYRDREYDGGGRYDGRDCDGRDGGGRWRERGRGRDRSRDWERERPRERDNYGRDGLRDRGRRPRDDSKRKERDARTVFVFQLSQKANEDSVYDLFSRAGRVRSVQLIVDRRSQRHKGQGYVEYHHVSSVREALSLSGELVCGFPVSVKATVEETEGGEEATPQSMNVSPPTPPVSGGVKREPKTVEEAAASAPPPLAASKLVSVKELIVLLNPHKLPVTAKTPSLGDGALNTSGANGVIKATIATANEIALPESMQVPLPIPGMATATAAPVLSAAQQLQQQNSFTRLYVGSVPFSVSEDDLLTVFSPFGAILSLQLQREAGTNRSRGYGFVEYADHASAKKALALNGLVLANRALKVNLASSTMAAPVTQQPLAAAQAAAASLSTGLGTAPLSTGSAADGLPQNVEGELDEGNEGGLAMNAARRAQLMQRLSRGADMGTLPSAAAPQYNAPCATTDEQTCCLLLSNMFDPVSESAANPSFDLELKEDIREEVTEKYGELKHLFVDKNSLGLVYLMFGDTGSALRAKTGLNGRWFGGLCIVASSVSTDVYKARLPDAPSSS